MNVDIHPSWKEALQEEFEKSYFADLASFIRSEYNTHTCYPGGSEIFAAFDKAPFDQLKAVIIGQDPYHGPGQANGLCFSVKNGIPHPPSLVNIFKEMAADTNQPYPESGDLERWARQGVLLLNATLTVRKSEAGSHQKRGWEQFTDAVIRKINEEHQGIIFMLWGGFAKKKASLIDGGKHHILSCGHPSPLSANRGLWFGNRHFSKTNELLLAGGKQGIQW